MKYSLVEIDEMRRIASELYSRETGLGIDSINPQSVEVRLRTYLERGISVEEMRSALGQNQKQTNG